jgi:hypothetical protein
MNRGRELADALLAYLGPVDVAEHAGMQITELELHVPLEISGHVRAGRFVIQGMPPHSRWKAGFLPPVHMTRLRVVAESAEA